jgi:hypothetical protein
MWFNRDAPGADLVLAIDEITHGTPLDLEKLEHNMQRNETRAARRTGGARKPPEQTWRCLPGKGLDAQGPGDWKQQAACKGKYNLMCYGATNVLVENPRRFTEESERAVAICMTCPVMAECREWAMSTPDPAFDHVAGGLTPWERRNIRKQHLKALPT